MKESKTLIIGLVVFTFLVLVVSGSYFSGREVLLAEVTEPNESVFEFVDCTNEPLIVISSEHEYPLTANIIGDDGVEREVTFEIIGDEIVCSTTAREAIEILYLCLCQSSIWEGSIDYGKGLPFRFAEPNEPNFIDLTVDFIDISKTVPNEPEEIYILDSYDPNAVLYYHEPEPEPTKYFFSFIPTWPDYIELEKDLVIDMSHKNDPNYPASYYTNWEIPKGTKIYFK